MKSTGFRTLPFPAARELIIDSGTLANRRHVAHGLLEIDVTSPRERIRRHSEQTGETISFTAYVIHCLAAAIEAHPRVAAYRGWRGDYVLFDDVDVSTLIEVEADSASVPHIIRRANQRTLREIHAEIRAIQTRTEHSPQDVGDQFWGLRLPRFIRLPLMRLGMKNPHTLKRFAGTVLVTSIGMFGSGSGWGVGFLPIHTLAVTLGGIGLKPAFVDGQLAARAFLCVTISFDHDIVDGAPVARFASHFAGLLSEGYGLDSFAEAEMSTPV